MKFPPKFNLIETMKAETQAYKDMGDVIKTANAFEDPYFDVWNVSRARVFSRQSKLLNKKLTEL